MKLTKKYPRAQLVMMRTVVKQKIFFSCRNQILNVKRLNDQTRLIQLILMQNLHILPASDPGERLFSSAGGISVP